MEQHLRCNNQVNGSICRAVLRQEAIVTTCAHIFCTQCANTTGLTRTPKEQRRCPACKSDLPNSYDVVRNLLDPPDDYKGSVLAGLDPATIMECAQKALSFWTYQNAQEHGYQQYMARHLTQRCQQLKTDADKIVHDANTRIEALEGRIQELSTDRHSMDQQYADLLRQYQEKHRKQQQTQKLYDAIKQKVQVEKMVVAANNDIDHTLQSIHTMDKAQRIHDHVGSRNNVYQSEPGTMINGAAPRFGPVQAVTEPLHPHQRSGSSAAGSSSQRLRMPPPDRVRNPRISNLMASNTPLQRTALPAQARVTIDRSQIPNTASRSSFPAAQALPGSSRRPQAPASKLPAPTQSYGAISSHMKVGRAGTSGSLDLGQNYSQYTGRMIQPARRSLDQTGAGIPYSAGYM